MKPGKKILCSTAFLACGLSGCVPPIPTSTCGAHISHEQCEQERRSFEGWIVLSCSEGALDLNVAQHIDPVLVPGLRVACREVASGMSLDDVYYNFVADIKCGAIEGGALADDRLDKFIDSTFGMFTKVDDMGDELGNQLVSLCSEFRKGRISGRDLLRNEARLYRYYENDARSTGMQELWAVLTWPIKLLVGLLGIIATVVGILVGLKLLFSKK